METKRTSFLRHGSCEWTSSSILRDIQADKLAPEKSVAEKMREVRVIFHGTGGNQFHSINGRQTGKIDKFFRELSAFQHL